MNSKNAQREDPWLEFIRLAIMLAALSAPAWAETTEAIKSRQKEVLTNANAILERGDISYTLGGNQLGNNTQCNACNKCLEKNHPQPSERLSQCPACQTCSMDCSHFITKVFQDSGLTTAYLTTALMRDLPPLKLKDNYNYIDMGRDLTRAQPGDLLVYNGHVVMLEKLRNTAKGDIIHATSGRDLSGPGLGIQRERFVDLRHFRGVLERILRHTALAANSFPSVKTPFRKIVPKKR